MPEHILFKIPDINTAPFNTHPIGTGPFLFHERVPGRYGEYKRNPNYHGNASKLEEADLIVIDWDILIIPENQIKEIKVDMTVLDGKIVYQR